MSINSNKIFQLHYVIRIRTAAKDMHKLFSLGCMGQSHVNDIENFQLQTNKNCRNVFSRVANQMLLLGV